MKRVDFTPTMRDVIPDDSEPDEEHRLDYDVHRLRGVYSALMSSGDKAGADDVLTWARPMQRRLREIRGLNEFARLCPVVWTRAETEAVIGAKIGHEVLRKLAAEPDALARSALLMGPSKAGKTLAVALMVRRYAAHVGSLKGVEWHYARELASVARYHPLGEGEPESLTRAKRAKVLVLDDLGLERDPAELVDVVHARYEASLPTITTTGLDSTQLVERYGEAFVRRLVEGQSALGRKVSCFPKAAERKAS